MNSSVIASLIRFLFFLIVQVLILKNINIYPPYVHVFIYPLFILLLPLKTPHWALLLLGFLMGICVDMFYYSYGLHAAAGVLIAYARKFVSQFLEPRGGYEINDNPNKTDLGFTWFLQYSSILMGIFVIYVFLLEDFSFLNIGIILLKSVIAFILSMMVILLHHFIFNPKN